MSQMTLNTLAMVTKAQKSVSNAQMDETISAPQRSLLLQLYWDLDDLQKKLILADLTTQVEAITKDSNALGTLTKQLQTQVTSINNAAQDVNTAATAVTALVNVFAAAAAAGIA